MGFEINVTLGPEWMKKAMVISHERSGTHFLMNTLADNFGYVSTEWINIDFDMPVNCWHPDDILRFLGCMTGKPVCNIVKSHHQVEFLLPILPQILEEFHVFYIYRHGAEVMESLCKHLKAIEWEVGPKVENGEALAKTAPSGGLLRYQMVQYPTMWDRWEAHISGWLGIPEDLQRRVIFIPFMGLRDDFEDVVKYIGHRIGRAVPETIIKPGKNDRVITPNIEAEVHHG